MKRIRILAALLSVVAFSSQAQTWDFSQVGSSDAFSQLGSDNTLWYLDETNNRYSYQQALNNEQLMANGSAWSFTQGLYFTAPAIASGKTQADGVVRIDGKKGCLNLNGKVDVRIANLKEGQTVTVVCKSSSSSTARGINVQNITPVSGSFNDTSVDQVTNVGTVTSNGDITLTSTGGLYVYSIAVSEGGNTPQDPDPDKDVTVNAVPMNLGVNQAYLSLKNGDVKYYNTAALQSIDIEGENVTVKPFNASTNDSYKGSVSNISFAKKSEQGEDAEFTNAEGKVFINESKGWLESAYVEWQVQEGVSNYAVYIKGGKYANWTKLDAQLVRNYGTYGRADAVGLVAASDYALRVVPIVNNEELTAQANEASSITVKNYQRIGFAHKNYSNIGAYNDDGSLKSNAVVVYVTKANAKTVTAKLNSGTFTGIQAIINAYQKGNVTVPLDVRVIGTISNGDTDKFESSEEGIQVKGRSADSEMNITIEGIGEDATIRGFGFLVRNSKSVEFRNLGIMRQMDDGISLDTDNSNIWIHHIDVFYGKQGSGDHAKGDGSIDVKSNSKFVTIDNCHFWDTGKSSMCGMKDESGPNYITYHHNWFDHSDSRHARVRTMSVHIWNNYYDGCSKYGIGATSGASVFSENNYFRATKDPIMISLQGTDAKGSGTFSGEEGGMIKEYGSLFTEKGSSSNYTPITYASNNKSFDFYQASARNEQVPTSIVTLSGSNAYNNFDTDASVMYDYTPDATVDVPSQVTSYYGAGRLNHGDLTFTFNKSEDTNYDVILELGQKLDSYKSSLVGIFGQDEIGGGDDNPDNPDTPDNPENPSGGGVISAPTYCVFAKDGTPSNASFIVNGNGSNSKGTATVNGVTYNTCLKMESSTSVQFETSADFTLSLYFASSEEPSIKIDGTKYTGNAGSPITVSLPAGKHELTKANTCNLFYIGLE